MNNIRKLAFIGRRQPWHAALISGLTKHEGCRLKRVMVCRSEPGTARARRGARNFRVQTAGGQWRGAVQGAEVVVLAVKPQQMRGVALWVGRRIWRASRPPGHIRGGRHSARIARSLVSDRRYPVIRTMPNRPALNGFGATGSVRSGGCGARHTVPLAETIMAAVSATRMGGARVADGPP